MLIMVGYLYTSNDLRFQDRTRIGRYSTKGNPSLSVFCVCENTSRNDEHLSKAPPYLCNAWWTGDIHHHWVISKISLREPYFLDLKHDGLIETEARDASFCTSKYQHSSHAGLSKCYRHACVLDAVTYTDWLWTLKGFQREMIAFMFLFKPLLSARQPQSNCPLLS